MVSSRLNRYATLGNLRPPFPVTSARLNITVTVWFLYVYFTYIPTKRCAGWDITVFPSHVTVSCVTPWLGPAVRVAAEILLRGKVTRWKRCWVVSIMLVGTLLVPALTLPTVGSDTECTTIVTSVTIVTM